MTSVEYDLVKKALLMHDEECGDTGFFQQNGSTCFFALVDGLGHGTEAHQAALLADHYLAANHDIDLKNMMQGLHATLNGSRGAVIALCRLSLVDGTMRYVGVGNITTRIFSAENSRMTPNDGVVGFSMSSLREDVLQLVPGDVVMLYSDGIQESFEEHDCPGLLLGSAEDITARVFDCFYKGDDDGSCLVVRYS